MKEKIMLIDGNSILNRAFYALPLLTNKEGEFTNGVYGFMNIFFKLYDEEEPAYVAVAFDLPGPTFRHERYTEYKGTRKPMPGEMRPQLPLLKNLLRKMNIAIYELAGYEADDVLGTLAAQATDSGLYVVVVSGDRDLLQLARETVMVRIPKTKSGKTEIEDYTAADVLERIGVTPQAYIDVKALMGDASDNIPGVPGIGEKTAVKIIQEFQTLGHAIDNAPLIKPKKASENIAAYKEQALMSKELATIITNAPVRLALEDSRARNLFNPAALEEAKRLGFKSMVSRFAVDPAQGNAPSEGNERENAGNHYQKITDVSAAQSFISQIPKDKPVAFHSVIDEGELLGIGFQYDPPSAVFLAVGADLGRDALLALCKPFFESDTAKLMLNAKNEMRNAADTAATLRNVVFDASLSGYIINASKTAYDYNDIAADFLSLDYPSRDEVFGKGRKKKEPVDEQALLAYACRQAEVVFAAYPRMMEIMGQNGQEDLYGNIELPLAAVLNDMELAGIKVDQAGLHRFGEELEVLIQSLTQSIYELAGEPFNINSPIQMGDILFGKLGLKGTKKTKQGYSTAAEVLLKLYNKHPVIPQILDYRTYTKLKSTYVDGLLGVMDQETQKIHSTFNQTITATGRISSTEPNLQNIPVRLPLGRQLRRVFIPSDEGYVFIDGDYSQIELRVLAHIAEDETLINAFNEGQDIHRLTASQVFKQPFSLVTDQQRNAAKAVNFGIVYGIGAFSLGEDLGISVKEAERYIQGYFEKYPGVKAYMERVVAQAREDGYVSTIFNRRRLLPEITSTNFNLRTFGERVAMNMPIQGSAADIIKIAMVKVHGRLKKEKLNARLLLQVHDELLLEAKREEADAVKAVVKQEMEQAVTLRVPLTTDMHVGETWYDVK